MSKLAAIEDAIENLCKGTLGNKVKTIEWAPPDWDEDLIKRFLLSLPGLFIIFAGAERIDPGGTPKLFRTRWILVAATKHAQNAKKRARGDGVTIGCYEILEAIVAKLDGRSIAEAGTLECISWDNDMALKLENQGLMVQSLVFEMTVDLSMDLGEDEAVPFLTFYGDYDVGQLEGAPATNDKVELEQ